MLLIPMYIASVCRSLALLITLCAPQTHTLARAKRFDYHVFQKREHSNVVSKFLKQLF